MLCTCVSPDVSDLKDLRDLKDLKDLRDLRCYLLNQNLLAVHDVDALLHLAEALTGYVVDGSLLRLRAGRSNLSYQVFILACVQNEGVGII